MGWSSIKQNPFVGKYSIVSNKNTTNQAGKFAKHVLKSNSAITNGVLAQDYEKVLKGGCTYLPNFLCSSNDSIIFENLKKEIDMNGMVNWSKHFKHEDPTFSKTFNSIVDQMAKHFGVKVLQTRLNYYKDGNDFKPMHKDRHAYGEGKNKVREDFTMGASIGAKRCLDFVHEGSGEKFSFPQNNGDVFAFNSEINQKFLHGVPKVSGGDEIGERFSIIAWQCLQNGYQIFLYYIPQIYLYKYI